MEESTLKQFVMRVRTWHAEALRRSRGLYDNPTGKVVQKQRLLLAEPAQISQRALKLTQYLYEGDFSSNARNHVRRATLGGLLFYAMRHYGLDFETVANCYEERVDVELSRLVAAVTPDIRQTSGKRLLDLKSRLGMAGIEAQLLQLSEIFATCQHVVMRAHNYDLLAMVSWRNDALDLHASLHAIHAAPKFRGVLRQVRDELQEFGRQLDEAGAEAAALEEDPVEDLVYYD